MKRKILQVLGGFLYLFSLFLVIPFQIILLLLGETVGEKHRLKKERLNTKERWG